MQAVGHAKIVFYCATLAWKWQVVAFNLMSSEERNAIQRNFYSSCLQQMSTKSLYQRDWAVVKVPQSQILQDKSHSSVMILNTFVGNDRQVHPSKTTDSELVSSGQSFSHSASPFQLLSPLVNVWLVPFQGAQINFTGSRAKWFPLLYAVHFEQHCAVIRCGKLSPSRVEMESSPHFCLL